MNVTWGPNTPRELLANAISPVIGPAEFAFPAARVFDAVPAAAIEARGHGGPRRDL